MLLYFLKNNICIHLYVSRYQITTFVCCFICHISKVQLLYSIVLGILSKYMICMLYYLSCYENKTFLGYYPSHVTRIQHLLLLHFSCYQRAAFICLYTCLLPKCIFCMLLHLSHYQILFDLIPILWYHKFSSEKVRNYSKISLSIDKKNSIDIVII